MSNPNSNTFHFDNTTMCDFSPCDICKKYPCPYYQNVLMHNSNFSQNLTYSINNLVSKITNFTSILDNRGFIVQEGKLSYIDILKLCSEGIVDNCLGNNVGAPYAICLLPPAPDSKKYPPNINYLVPGFTNKLRPDEAIMVVGTTPPPALYYCFRSYLGFVENKQDKDYSEYITAGDDETGSYHMIFASLGDQINNYNIATANTPEGKPGNPFDSLTAIVSTADRNINKEIRNALITAGYSPDIINDDNIPMDLVHMGLEAGKDTFTYMMRMALWADQTVGNQFLNNINNYLKVFRITPKKPLINLQPWPILTLKIRETGITEYQIIPNSRNELDHMRNEIIKKYGGTDYEPINLNLSVGIPDNFNAILRDMNIYGDDRDAVYFKTEDFQLKDDDDFLIIYGINHNQSGKAIYSNASFYGAKLFNGVVGAFSTVQFPDSATQYFPEGYESAKYYYVYKMARKANEDNVVIIPYSTGNPLGKAYGVDNNQDARIIFRVYLDKIAMVGPYIFDIIWDQVILFRKKKS